MTSMLDKLMAFVRRDLITALRYRTAFWTAPIGIVIEIATLYYMARAIGPGFRPDGIDYFPFLIVGTAYISFVVGAVSSFVDTVHDSQMTGTMEVLMTTATPGTQIVLLSSLSQFGGPLITNSIGVLAAVAVIRLDAAAVNVPALLLSIVFSVAVAVGIGMIAAAVQLFLQRGKSLIWLVGSVTALLSGTMFPVSALPKPLQRVAELIPVTYAIDSLRLALLRGYDTAPLHRSLLALAVSAVILLPLGLWTFAYVLKKVRRYGTLSFY